MMNGVDCIHWSQSKLVDDDLYEILQLADNIRANPIDDIDLPLFDLQSASADLAAGNH